VIVQKVIEIVFYDYSDLLHPSNAYISIEILEMLWLFKIYVISHNFLDKVLKLIFCFRGNETLKFFVIKSINEYEFSTQFGGEITNLSNKIFSVFGVRFPTVYYLG
jgi:hypothetical protein